MEKAQVAKMCFEFSCFKAIIAEPAKYFFDFQLKSSQLEVLTLPTPVHDWGS